MSLPPIPEPGGPDGPPRTTDQILLGVIAGPVLCDPCGKWIVQVETGVWRTDEKSHADDRIVCAFATDRRHHPLGGDTPAPPPAGGMRRTSPPQLPPKPPEIWTGDST